jgi:hypothetical protein
VHSNSVKLDLDAIDRVHAIDELEALRDGLALGRHRADRHSWRRLLGSNRKRAEQQKGVHRQTHQAPIESLDPNQFSAAGGGVGHSRCGPG